MLHSLVHGRARNLLYHAGDFNVAVLCVEKLQVRRSSNASVEEE
jgi:hypothetical protein